MKIPETGMQPDVVRHSLLKKRIVLLELTVLEVKIRRAACFQANTGRTQYRLLTL